jgi:isopenicillin N synthase-like dioxygenase
VPLDSFTQLPLVDVSAFYAEDTAARLRAAAALGSAARYAGFLYVAGHRVPQASIERLKLQSKAFFALPLAEKMRWYIGHSKHHKGYVPEGEEIFSDGARDRKEAFDLGFDLPPDDPEVRCGTPMLGPNLWPDVPGFRDDVAAYYDAVFDLGKRLFRGYALALGLAESHFDPLVTKPPSQLRLIHYPYDPEVVDAQGIGTHTDYECFTILLATAPGLEVRNGAGVWIDAPPLEGAFIVNIGDMMEIWTNGEFVATAHRVRRVPEERYSFPLFCACDYHTVVEPLPAFLTSDRPARYPSVTAGDHLYAQTVRSFAYLKERSGGTKVESAAGFLPELR